MSAFYDAIEGKDYAKAYGIYENDPQWQQHAEKYAGYPLARFTEDWTTYSPINGPITVHHIDVSRTDGTGRFGSGIIVGATVNGEPRVFLYCNLADGILPYPSPHIIEY